MKTKYIYIYVRTLEHYSLLALNTNVSYFFFQNTIVPITKCMKDKS